MINSDQDLIKYLQLERLLSDDKHYVRRDRVQRIYSVVKESNHEVLVIFRAFEITNPYTGEPVLSGDSKMKSASGKWFHLDASDKPIIDWMVRDLNRVGERYERDVKRVN